MKNKSNATPELNTIILLGMAQRLESMNPESLNLEGEAALLVLRNSLEDLIYSASAIRLLKKLEQDEDTRAGLVQDMRADLEDAKAAMIERETFGR